MSWLVAFPDLLTAAGLLLVWLRPDLAGADWLAGAVELVLLEFFVVHASGFFTVVMYGEGSRALRSALLAGLACVYLLLVGGFAWALQAWWMVSAFLWLAFGKVQAVWGHATPSQRAQAKQAAFAGWMAGMACYLAAVMASALLPWPPLGVTPAAIAAAHFSGGGLWIERPYTALAGGVLYFTAMGLVRGGVRSWLARRAARDPVYGGAQ